MLCAAVDGQPRMYAALFGRNGDQPESESGRTAGWCRVETRGEWDGHELTRLQVMR